MALTSDMPPVHYFSLSFSLFMFLSSSVAAISLDQRQTNFKPSAVPSEQPARVLDLHEAPVLVPRDSNKSKGMSPKRHGSNSRPLCFPLFFCFILFFFIFLRPLALDIQCAPRHGRLR